MESVGKTGDATGNAGVPRKAGGGDGIRYACAEVPSPVGPLGIAVTAVGLVALSFGPAERAEQAVTRLPGLRPAGNSALDRRLREVRDQLDEYFDGGRDEFTIPLDWRLSSGFGEQVLRELLIAAPHGVVLSYGELAARMSPPDDRPSYEAARAVGRALGANPIAIVVPCHRVLASDGSLHGFGGGLETKRRLLALEGVLPLTLDDAMALS